MIQRSSATILLALLCVGGISGCLFNPKDNDKPPPPIVEFEPRTTIKGVLNNLIKSYEDRNFDEYEKLFDHELFTFEVSEIDVIGQNGQDPLPAFWGWEFEGPANRNMFAHEDVISIELDFSFPAARPVEEADDPPAEAEMMTFLTNLELIVTAHNPEDPNDQNIFIVDNDRHEFFFRQDPEETQDGEPVWKILEWRDKALPPGEGLLAAGSARP